MLVCSAGERFFSAENIYITMLSMKGCSATVEIYYNQGKP